MGWLNSPGGQTMQGEVDWLETGTLGADDVLDRETVDRIEELHAAVAHAEAEQRFGMLRGKRSAHFTEAEDAERAFLNSLGFASYNDYRLRIRRSTAATGWADERGADGRSEPPPAGAPEATDAGGPVWAQAGEADERAVAEPLDEASGGPDQPHESPAAVFQRPPEVLAPGAERPERGPLARGVNRGRAEGAPALCAELAYAVDGFFAQLCAETDRLVEDRLKAAEQQAAGIREQAAHEAAELMGQARVVGDAVKAVVDNLAHLSDVVLRATSTVGLLPEVDA